MDEHTYQNLIRMIPELYNESKDGLEPHSKRKISHGSDGIWLLSSSLRYQTSLRAHEVGERIHFVQHLEIYCYTITIVTCTLKLTLTT